MNTKKQLFKLAKHDVRTLVFSDAFESEKVIEAIKYLTKKRIMNAIILGNEDDLYSKFGSLNLVGIQIMDPETSDLTAEFAEEILRSRKPQIAFEDALDLSQNFKYFASLLVKNGYADGVVFGNEKIKTIDIDSAVEFIKNEKSKLVSTATLFTKNTFAFQDKALLVSDCFLYETPEETELVKIASNALELWHTLFLEEPKLAFLSCKNKENPTSSKMFEVCKQFKKSHKDVVCSGGISLKDAVFLGHKKTNDNLISGDANIFILPDITSSHILCDSLKYLSSFEATGIIFLGTKRPANHIIFDSSLEEIVNLCAITAIQSQI